MRLGVEPASGARIPPIVPGGNGDAVAPTRAGAGVASGASVTRARDPGAVGAARLSAARAPGLKRAATETPGHARRGENW